jgi:hypothetical protein
MAGAFAGWGGYLMWYQGWDTKATLFNGDKEIFVVKHKGLIPVKTELECFRKRIDMGEATHFKVESLSERGKAYVDQLNVGTRKAPWPDYAGEDIFEGDRMLHPSGESGVVTIKPEHGNINDMWVVKYSDGVESRLCLQIGEKGQAVVV